MSGGVFQNMIFQSGLARSLKNRGFEVYTNRKVPANDGGAFAGSGIDCRFKFPSVSYFTRH